MCIPLKNNLCRTPPNARCLYTVEKNKHIVDRLDSQIKLCTVIFLTETMIPQLCDAAFSNICITSNRLWAENNNCL